MNNYKYKGTNNLRVYAHRLIMEQYLGRKLLSSEIVHHIDGDKSNNDIKNLELTTRKKHASIHTKGREIKWKDKIGKSLKIWHDSLSKKEKDELTEKIKKGIKSKFPNGRIAWNKGLTKK